MLAGRAAILATPHIARAQGKPKVTVISQWSAGSDGLAITTLGKRFEAEGGIWEHNPVPGFTTEMMNKLRAQIIAGDPPAASQLKGPEIAAWSKIGAVVDLDAQVKEAGYEAVVPAELVRLSKPYGHWIALPIQAYRINTLFISKKAADRVGVSKLARHLGRVQRHRREDEGGRHHAGGERRAEVGRRHEVGDRALRHQSRRLSQGGDATGRQDVEGSRGACRIPPVPQARRVVGSGRRRPALQHLPGIAT